MEDKVDLAKQENYVCLGCANDVNTDSALIKQRFQAWKELRKSCPVTINKAVGLEGLKQQKLHLDIKSGRKEPEPVPDDLQRKFDYWTRNELNAVASLVSTVFPAFEAGASLYEEGCYVVENDGRPSIVIIPDGSLRKDSNVLAGIEIKCPMPRKIYTNPVQYTLPHYYVPQVLSEMNCLSVTQLYFVYFGQESTAVHIEDFDEKLWNDLVVEVNSLDHERTPKRLSPNIPNLKQSIEQFKTSKV
ncbi:hypothetical protein MAR_030055 [Mya arenaria]|uniref:YqaJ viral recombinase domain-containing protein n=1 Tax=Mya arenaria TaxID=6604 RepID=A0ABY7DL00_MYAAR|nr:hypothetical protein MAR_030055 [Mya arenaria]